MQDATKRAAYGNGGRLIRARVNQAARHRSGKATAQADALLQIQQDLDAILAEESIEKARAHAAAIAAGAETDTHKEGQQC